MANKKRSKDTPEDWTLPLFPNIDEKAEKDVDEPLSAVRLQEL